MIFHVAMLGASSLVAGWCLSRWQYHGKLQSRQHLSRDVRSPGLAGFLGFFFLAGAAFELAQILYP